MLVLNGKVLLIRPKQYLASDGNYREERWFSPWKHRRTVDDFLLPEGIRKLTGKETIARDLPNAFARSNPDPGLAARQASRLCPLAIAICRLGTQPLASRRARSCSRLIRPISTLALLELRYSATALVLPFSVCVLAIRVMNHMTWLARAGSHHQLRKLHQRVDLMHNATRKNGGLYLYANQQVRLCSPSQARS